MIICRTDCRNDFVTVCSHDILMRDPINEMIDTEYINFITTQQKVTNLLTRSCVKIIYSRPLLIKFFKMKFSEDAH